jgi:hypothetical protein
VSRAGAQRIVSEIGAGTLDVSTSLRENDELRGFPLALAELVTSLVTTVEGLRRAHSELRSAVETLPEDPSTAERLAAIREHLQEAEQEVARFKRPTAESAR